MTESCLRRYSLFKLSDTMQHYLPRSEAMPRLYIRFNDGERGIQQRRDPFKLTQMIVYTLAYLSIKNKHIALGASDSSQDQSQIELSNLEGDSMQGSTDANSHRAGMS